MHPKDPSKESLTSFDGKRVIIGNGEVQCLGPISGHDDGCGQLDNWALLAHLGSDGRKVADAGSKSRNAAAWQAVSPPSYLL